MENVGYNIWTSGIPNIKIASGSTELNYPVPSPPNGVLSLQDWRHGRTEQKRPTGSSSNPRFHWKSLQWHYTITELQEKVLWSYSPQSKKFFVCASFLPSFLDQTVLGTGDPSKDSSSQRPSFMVEMTN